ncbi:MAG: methionine adenosyltransferase [Deltaproteobacteria bacterium]|nr:methionine adenosyltransferase [Deltaproteobacteria bacterium]
MSQKFVFTSESVTEGHPDKIADQISDGILDALIKEDPKSRVACETLVATGLVVLAGEITSNAIIDYQKVTRETIEEIGYTDSSYGFDSRSCSVLVALGKQSPDISQGVTEGEGLFKEQGAGDQGLMFGYATNETPEFMPLPISLSHKLTQRLAEVRKKKTLNFLRPDGKSQVSVRYENDRPQKIKAVVLSSQHDPDVSYKTLKEALIEEVVKKVCPANMLDAKTEYFINPTGRFVVGGPHGDCGLTGRKIIVDTYGGWGRHGGGAFSGKDPSKVDRSACYMARYIAKNIVAARLADRCEVQIAYAIGYPEPVSFMINSFGTGVLPDEKLAEVALKVWSLKPAQIIKTLNLLRPIYKKTAAYGHFGRNLPEFTWEKTDRAAELASLAGLNKKNGGKNGTAKIFTLPKNGKELRTGALS